MKKLLIPLCLTLLCSCSSFTQPKGEKYTVKDIVLIKIEKHQDYWSKHMGVSTNKNKHVYYYDVALTNERQDTTISTRQFININKNQIIGKKVFVTEGRIM